MAGLPGYKRGSWGVGHVASHSEGYGDTLCPEKCAVRYYEVYGRDYDRACAALERDAGDVRLQHHFMRQAARLLRGWQAWEVAYG